jgi:peptidoglycan/xylan/chitin deacetylase (PgdA/CDA1 family)
MYHYFCDDEQTPDALTVRASDFRRQMAHLADHFRVEQASRTFRAAFEGRGLAEPVVCVTVDDVGEDFHRYAWPVLESLSIPATLALCPGLAPGLGERELAFGVAHALLRNGHVTREQLARELGIPGLSYDGAWEALRPVETGRLTRALERLGLFPEPEKRVPGYVRFPLLGLEPVRRMAATGLVEVASHTMSHPALGPLRGDWLRWEVQESRRRIVEAIGECSIFVYPGGQRTMPAVRGEEAILEAGYEFAMTGPATWVPSRCGPMTIGRMTVVGDESFAEFRLRVSGLMLLLKGSLPERHFRNPRRT